MNQDVSLSFPDWQGRRRRPSVSFSHHQLVGVLIKFDWFHAGSPTTEPNPAPASDKIIANPDLTPEPFQSDNPQFSPPSSSPAEHFPRQTDILTPRSLTQPVTYTKWENIRNSSKILGEIVKVKARYDETTFSDSKIVKRNFPGHHTRYTFYLETLKSSNKIPTDGPNKKSC